MSRTLVDQEKNCARWPGFRKGEEGYVRQIDGTVRLVVWINLTQLTLLVVGCWMLSATGEEISYWGDASRTHHEPPGNTVGRAAKIRCFWALIFGGPRAPN